MKNELLFCASSGNLEQIKKLVVEEGANIEETNHNGNTALSLASLKGHLEIVVYLVEHGANVAHTCSEGMTALHWACIVADPSSERGRLEVVKYLLSSEGGASITETDNLGNTALLVADEGCCPTIIHGQWLLEYGGAQITDKNKAVTFFHQGGPKRCGL
jgi:ankyrin repeat protein